MSEAREGPLSAATQDQKRPSLPQPAFAPKPDVSSSETSHLSEGRRRGCSPTLGTSPHCLPLKAMSCEAQWKWECPRWEVLTVQVAEQPGDNRTVPKRQNLLREQATTPDDGGSNFNQAYQHNLGEARE